MSDGTAFGTGIRRIAIGLGQGQMAVQTRSNGANAIELRQVHRVGGHGAGRNAGDLPGQPGLHVAHRHRIASVRIRLCPNGHRAGARMVPGIVDEIAHARRIADRYRIDPIGLRIRTDGGVVAVEPRGRSPRTQRDAVLGVGDALLANRHAAVAHRRCRAAQATACGAKMQMAIASPLPACAPAQY